MKRLTVYSDYVCPFCFLAMPALERLERDEGVQADWRAFELRPEPVPTLDPAGAYLTKIWRDAVYPLAARLGVPIRLPPVQPRSRPAFIGAEYAKEHGKFAEYHRAVFEAFFQQGLNIGDVAVLGGIAQQVGLAADEFGRALGDQRYLQRVLEQEQEAEDQGIRAVPTMICGESAIEGLVAYPVLLRAARDSL